jgi:predicted HTH domain antitoxin
MVMLNFPPQVEDLLREQFGDHLEQTANEGIALEGYQTGKLSAGEVARIVGLETSIEALAWLGRRDVPLNYSIEDLESDRAALAQLFPGMRG